MSNKKKEFFLVRWFKRCFLHERPELSTEEEEKIQTPMRAMVANFVHRPLAMIGLIVFLAIFVFVMVGPHIWVLDLSEQDSTLTNLPPSHNMMEVPKALLANGADFSKVDTIISNNDDMALGAIEALKQAGVDTSKMKIVGIDGTQIGLQAILDGDMTATVFQSTSGQAAASLQAAVSSIRARVYSPVVRSWVYSSLATPCRVT